ncbi:hypothetical protein CRUP_002006 [Coryphaenoides rupestris]|nr:hypothetical protein CRUP_002006 [Coryphaenoides rupestris]
MKTLSPVDFNLSLLEEGFTAQDSVDQTIKESSMGDDRDAFYVCDLGDLVKKHLRWAKALPRVTPFYAVKCNNSASVVRTLASLGCGFDCASKAEIQLVESLGVVPSRIIYANPCKQTSQIKYASSHGVQKMTFDSEVELMKVARCHENAKLVLRIATDDSNAVCPLSVKFGATLKGCRSLLQRAKELSLDVIGVSFHVGSMCRDPSTYTQAISDARCVFDMAEEFGYKMNLLDIGGGFPGSEDVKLKFEEITAIINPALDKYFPVDGGVRVIAEPGRYYVASACTLAVNIIAKKVIMEEKSASNEDEDDEANEKTMMYYVNDGKPKPDEAMYTCSIWGPTCDGLDRIAEHCSLPDLQVNCVSWWLLRGRSHKGFFMIKALMLNRGLVKDAFFICSLRKCMQQINTQGMPAPAEETGPACVAASCGSESAVDLPTKICQNSLA